MPKVDKNPVFRAGMIPPVENERTAPPAKAASAPPLPPKQTKEEKQVYREKMGPPPMEPDSGSAVPKKMAKGGSASSRADGCCQRGKTRGRMV